MPLYSYSKKGSLYFKKRFLRIISLFLITGGLVLLLMVVYPIASFQLFYAHKFPDLTSPVIEASEKKENKIKSAFSVVFADLTRASLWFPQAAPALVSPSARNTYELSIPKLKIENANVIIGSDDLSQSLIQFTAGKPGALGNPVIFGHSTLLFFYNPKDYKTIFSKLPDLKEGDEININYDKVNYVYRVYKMYITSAKDLSVLNQNSTLEELTLVTCVPPGTYLKRFIVKARLEQ